MTPDLVERVGEALFDLSDSLRKLGTLNDDEAHRRYERVVSEWQKLSAAMPPQQEAGEDGPWLCFHCGDVFRDQSKARLHFGRDEGSMPACVIKGADGGLLRALRDAEEQADDAIQAMHNESTDAAKAYHSQRCRHTQALIAAEEAGYERGLADGQALASQSAAPQQEGVGERREIIARAINPAAFRDGDVGGIRANQRQQAYLMADRVLAALASQSDASPPLVGVEGQQ